MSRIPTPCRPPCPRLAAGALSFAAVFHAVFAASGCATEPRSGPAGTGEAASVSTAVAYVAGRPVGGEEFELSLREASGVAVLEEIVLDRLIHDRLEQRGVAVPPEYLEAERLRLLAALDPDPDAAQRLLSTLRSERGLGPERFDRLLRRNAGLRLLVAGEVEVSDAAVRRAFDRSHGRRSRVRLLTADLPAEAEALRTRVLEGAAFAEVAAKASTDASRERGGLLAPVHADDPTFPAALRDAIGRLAPGELSGVVALGDGFGVVRLEEVLPADGAVFTEEEATLRAAVRADLERQRMEQLARTLRAEADVVVLDPTLQPGS